MKYADLGPLVKPLTDAFFIIITLIPIMQVFVFLWDCKPFLMNNV